MAGNEPDESTPKSGEMQYDPTSSRYDLYDRPECDTVVLALGRDEPPMSCHDKPMGA